MIYRTILERLEKKFNEIFKEKKKKRERENARKIFHKILHCIKPLQDDCILQSSYEGVVDMKKIVRHTENSPNLVRSIAFGRR